MTNENTTEKKIGWITHYVGAGDPQVPAGCANIHTHGVPELYPGSLNFQVLVPLELKVASDLMHCLVERVRTGERFVTGFKYNNVIEKMDVMFIIASESNRPVMRVILPDPAGSLEEASMSSPFNLQYEVQY